MKKQQDDNRAEMVRVNFAHTAQVTELNLSYTNLREQKEAEITALRAEFEHRRN